MQNRLLFITGRGRSGTWLLQTILDAHPEMVIAPESIFLINLKNKYHKIGSWDKKVIDNFINDLKSDQKIVHWWSLDFGLLERSLIETSDLNYAKACMLVYKQYSISQGNASSVAYLGDKNPEYSLKIRDVLEIYPDAKIIILVRDPRDNISSYLNVNFDLNNPIALAARWNFYIKRILSDSEDHPKNIRIFQYEKLLEQPASVLQQMCDFLEITYTDDLLSFYENPKNVFEWNKQIGSALNKENAYKWKRNKTSSWIPKVSKLCSHYIEILNYEQAEQKDLTLLDRLNYLYGIFISRLEMLYYTLPVFLKNLILKIYRRLTKTFSN